MVAAAFGNEALRGDDEEVTQSFLGWATAQSDEDVAALERTLAEHIASRDPVVAGSDPLLPAQSELLQQLVHVETDENEVRAPFYIVRSIAGTRVGHPSLAEPIADVQFHDIEALDSEGYIRLSATGEQRSVTRKGIDYVGDQSLLPRPSQRKNLQRVIEEAASLVPSVQLPPEPPTVLSVTTERGQAARSLGELADRLASLETPIDDGIYNDYIRPAVDAAEAALNAMAIGADGWSEAAPMVEESLDNLSLAALARALFRYGPMATADPAQAAKNFELLCDLILSFAGYDPR